MCFGPTASFTASGVLAVFGSVIFRNIRSSKEVFLAAFPLIFAFQQLIEGLIWVALY